MLRPIILSNSKVFNYYNSTLPNPIDFQQIDSISQAKDGAINLLQCYGDERVSVEPGAFTKQSGKCAMIAVEKGIELCKSEQADALVTAPISKEAVNLAGYQIPGHTEFLAEHTNTSDFMMMLCHDDLRVGLATVHIPLAEVPSNLSKDSIAKYIQHPTHHPAKRLQYWQSPNCRPRAKSPCRGRWHYWQ
ncbi:MAG: 4-hydroxythreonine-4-phosphate dehydrogenase PdxA [Fodinibius sp.]|nr:4-hydroxythreonine-4-phosphate dehydrogenase PdxA [Fodinibius sp.]